ncbi:MAG TPA: hypothetical protein PLB02_04100 [Thermoanaerobaculia bacterium]|nr:hypothetical protein [Thermoanaerobaculia bacterium]HQR66554.1 hypothetical protein [Thermoanaerobaculia bacterium]
MSDDGERNGPSPSSVPRTWEELVSPEGLAKMSPESASFFRDSPDLAYGIFGDLFPGSPAEHGIVPPSGESRKPSRSLVPSTEACKAANAHPISVLAREKLLQAGAAADSRALYPAQLMRWGLESGAVRLDPDLADRLLPMLDQIEYLSPPDEALAYLLGPEDEAVDPKLHESESPKEFAETLWEQLHSRMTATIDGYARPTTE